MTKCDNCGKEWHKIQQDDENTFCLGCGEDRPSDEYPPFIETNIDHPEYYECVVDAMDSKERAAIIDKYYDF